MRKAKEVIKLTNEQKKIISDNHNLIYSYLKLHSLLEDEFYDIVAIGLCKAVQTYKPEISSLSTYSYFIMDNEIKQEYRRRYYKNKNKIISLDSECNYDNENSYSKIYLQDIIADKINKIENNSVNFFNCFYKILDQLNYKNKKIVYLLIKGYSQMEVADKINFSQSYVSRVYKKFKEDLLKELRCYS